MEFGQFVVMFKSIFCEGLARPREGVRRIINVLRRKVREVGGTVRMRCGVKALHVEDGHVRSVELDNGGTLTAHTILSSPRYVETLRPCDDGDPEPPAPLARRPSFVEIISILAIPMKSLGHN